jgi:hypothetical protein
VGKLTLIDNDHIEKSNLTRQFLYTEKSVGKEKVIALKDALLERNNNVEIDTISLHVKKDSDLDIIILSADKPENLVFWVNDLSIRTNTPFLNIGYVEDIVVWGPFVIPGKTGCWRCKKLISSNKEYENSEFKHLIKKINKNYQVPSHPATNMAAAANGTNDILKYLGKFGEVQSLNKRFSFLTYKSEIKSQDCRRNTECELCSTI